jgi:hypothetical protein
MAYRSFSLSGFEARGVRKVTTGCIPYRKTWIALVQVKAWASRVHVATKARHARGNTIELRGRPYGRNYQLGMET